MISLWNDEEASRYAGDLAVRVYTSRLLGRDTSLVLHGGGNTSVKVRERNLFGEEEEILYVKGSGWDLETIEEAGFTPLRLDHVRRLASLPSLSDPAMVNELVTHTTRSSAPVPSVEAILHGILPFTFVDHTHADAVVAVTNTPDGEGRIREIYGDAVVIIPYVMPGFALARLCAERFARDAGPHTIGMVLLNHGIFSFGDTARQSYERMIDLVSRAERYLERGGAGRITTGATVPAAERARTEIATLRNEISTAAGFPMVLRRDSSEKALAFAQRDDLMQISQQGPATPDHVIRTKRLPMVGRDTGAYVEQYRRYFDEQRSRASEPVTMLDPAPRVVLDARLGLLTAGRSARDAAIVRDIYHHTMAVILGAEAIGGYRALPAGDLFDVEYWDLEQAKLRKGGAPPLFAGEVALVTGAASGIGRACVESLLKRGAAVIGLDIDAAIGGLFNRADFLGVRCDVTSGSELADALEAGVNAFGGADMLILNAGVFPAGHRIESLEDDAWRTVMGINLDANLMLLRESYPLLRLAPRGGRVVVIGSKNVPAPGPGAAAYSASKAALTQLARVAALEWGGHGIRVNTLHPDAVFDTGIWTEEVLAARARHYDLTVDEYKRKNILKTEVYSRDVAELAAELCGPLFAKTTGAQIPVDGGNVRVV
jgi:rhamnose utilization protein RhaD (predicted bifunctional aldolase and dehydrogenase)/NAD(P)-dependent dehydrogenase (short-subunit alcohol dehydrogenase family)